MKIEFFSAAEEELLESASHYEQLVAGLGNDLVFEVERLVAVLAELPSLGEKLDRIHHRMPLRRFPYGLIFRRDGDILRVVAVAHRRRKPTYWKGRVQDR